MEEILSNSEKQIIDICIEIDGFPTSRFLRKEGRYDLIYFINENGGFYKYKQNLGFYIYRKPAEYTEDIINKLEESIKTIILSIKKFPSYRYLRFNKRQDLIDFIVFSGGFSYYRKKLGFKWNRKDSGNPNPPYYWNNPDNIKKEIDNIINELKKLMNIIGRFPTTKEIANYNSKLSYSIKMTGSIYKYYEIFKIMPYKVPVGFWCDENIIIFIQEVIDKIHDFPTSYILQEIYGNGILLAIQKKGGMKIFREKMGYKLTTRGKISLYSKWRGELSEKMLELIINSFSKHNDITIIKNKRFPDNGIVEFYIIENESKATCCVDITATSNYKNIVEKWTDRNYHLYVDIVFIVVFSLYLKEDDYEKLNKMCPTNVYVLNIFDFIEGFKYKYDVISKEDIIKLEKYTFDKYMKYIYR